MPSAPPTPTGGLSKIRGLLQLGQFQVTFGLSELYKKHTNPIINITKLCMGICNENIALESIYLKDYKVSSLNMGGEGGMDKMNQWGPHNVKVSISIQSPDAAPNKPERLFPCASWSSVTCSTPPPCRSAKNIPPDHLDIFPAFSLLQGTGRIIFYSPPWQLWSMAITFLCLGDMSPSRKDLRKLVRMASATYECMVQVKPVLEPCSYNPVMKQLKPWKHTSQKAALKMSLVFDGKWQQNCLQFQSCFNWLWKPLPNAPLPQNPSKRNKG